MQMRTTNEPEFTRIRRKGRRVGSDRSSCLQGIDAIKKTIKLQGYSNACLLVSIRGSTRLVALGIGALATMTLSFSAAQAQLVSGLGPSRDFSLIEYFDPPFDGQMMTRMTSAESRPVPGSKGLLDIRQFKLESFTTNGRPEMVITAPQCTFSTLASTANSAGPIQVLSGDGQFSLAGEGFFWRQNERLLNISNRVVTVISSNAPAVLKTQTKSTEIKP